MKAPTRPFAFIMRQRSTQFIKLMFADYTDRFFSPCPIVIDVHSAIVVSLVNVIQIEFINVNCKGFGVKCRFGIAF